MGINYEDYAKVENPCPDCDMFYLCMALDKPCEIQRAQYILTNNKDCWKGVENGTERGTLRESY